MTLSSDEEVVKLISADGQEFLLEKTVAMGSGTIRSILSAKGMSVEASKNEIHFREIRGNVLQKVCDYLYYKQKYQDSAADVPEFAIDPDMALELMMAADFLDT